MSAGRIVIAFLLLITLGVLIKFALMLMGIYVPSASITGQQPPIQQAPAPEPTPEPTPKPEPVPPVTSKPAPPPPPARQPDAKPQPEPDDGPQPGAGEDEAPRREEPSGEADKETERGTGNGETVPDQGAVPARPARYVVRPGDTLWGIARRFCGAGARYRVLYRRNRGHIRNPDKIWPGQAVELTDNCR